MRRVPGSGEGPRAPAHRLQGKARAHGDTDGWACTRWRAGPRAAPSPRLRPGLHAGGGEGRRSQCGGAGRRQREPQGRAASWGVGVCSQGRAGPIGKRDPEEKREVRRGEGGAEAARSRRGPQVPSGALGLAGGEGGWVSAPSLSAWGQVCPSPCSDPRPCLCRRTPRPCPASLALARLGPAGQTNGQEARGGQCRAGGLPSGLPEQQDPSVSLAGLTGQVGASGGLTPRC